MSQVQCHQQDSNSAHNIQGSHFVVSLGFQSTIRYPAFDNDGTQFIRRWYVRIPTRDTRKLTLDIPYLEDNPIYVPITHGVR
jgi:hypothetical protein